MKTRDGFHNDTNDVHSPQTTCRHAPPPLRAPTNSRVRILGGISLLVFAMTGVVNASVPILVTKTKSFSLEQDRSPKTTGAVVIHNGSEPSNRSKPSSLLPNRSEVSDPSGPTDSQQRSIDAQIAAAMHLKNFLDSDSPSSLPPNRSEVSDQQRSIDEQIAAAKTARSGTDVRTVELEAQFECYDPYCSNPVAEESKLCTTCQQEINDQLTQIEDAHANDLDLSRVEFLMATARALEHAGPFLEKCLGKLDVGGPDALNDTEKFILSDLEDRLARTRNRPRSFCVRRRRLTSRAAARRP